MSAAAPPLPSPEAHDTAAATATKDSTSAAANDGAGAGEVAGVGVGTGTGVGVGAGTGAAKKSGCERQVFGPSALTAIATIARAVKQMEQDTHATHQQMERTQAAVRSVARSSRSQRRMVQLMGKRMSALEQRLNMCLEGEALMFRQSKTAKEHGPCPRAPSPTPVNSPCASASRTKEKAPRSQSTSVATNTPPRDDSAWNVPIRSSASFGGWQNKTSQSKSNSPNRSNALSNSVPRTDHKSLHRDFDSDAPSPKRQTINEIPQPKSRTVHLIPVVSPTRPSLISRSMSCTITPKEATRSPSRLSPSLPPARRSMSFVDPHSSGDRPGSLGAWRVHQRPNPAQGPGSRCRNSSVPHPAPVLPRTLALPCPHVRSSHPFPPRPSVPPVKKSRSSAVRLPFLSSEPRPLAVCRAAARSKLKSRPHTRSPSPPAPEMLPRLKPASCEPQKGILGWELQGSRYTPPLTIEPNQSPTVSRSISFTSYAQQNFQPFLPRNPILPSPPFLPRSRSLTNSTAPHASSPPPTHSCRPPSPRCYPRRRHLARASPERARDTASCKKCLSALGRYLLTLAHEGRVEELRAVLDSEVDVNFANSLRWTPLHKAAAKAHYVAVAMLLDKGADVQARTSYGFTPLHLAAYNDRSGRCVSLLVRAGADVDSRSRSGRTALDYADDSGNAEAARVLEEAGASRSSAESHRLPPLPQPPPPPPLTPCVTTRTTQTPADPDTRFFKDYQSNCA